MGIVGSFMESSLRTRICDTIPAIDGRGVTTESDQTIDRTNWRTFTLFGRKKEVEETEKRESRICLECGLLD